MPKQRVSEKTNPDFLHQLYLLHYKSITTEQQNTHTCSVEDPVESSLS